MAIRREWSPGEDAELLRLRREGVTFREIALMLRRRKQYVLDRWHELEEIPVPPPPPHVQYPKDVMSYSDYRKMRTKTYPTWLFAVTFHGLWARVRDGKQADAWGSSKFARTLSYGAQYREARDASGSRAMAILLSSEVYLVRVLSVDVVRIRQFRGRP